MYVFRLDDKLYWMKETLLINIVSWHQSLMDFFPSDKKKKLMDGENINYLFWVLYYEYIDDIKLIAFSILIDGVLME